MSKALLLQKELIGFGAFCGPPAIPSLAAAPQCATLPLSPSLLPPSNSVLRRLWSPQHLPRPSLITLPLSNMSINVTERGIYDSESASTFLSPCSSFTIESKSNAAFLFDLLSRLVKTYCLGRDSSSQSLERSKNLKRLQPPLLPLWFPLTSLRLLPMEASLLARTL